MVRLPPSLRPLFPYLKPVVVRVTRGLAPASIRWSRRGRVPLPAVSVASLADIDPSEGRAVRARAAESLTRGPMPGWPAGLALSDRSDGDTMDDVWAAELTRGRVLGRHRAVITGDNRLVQRPSRYFGTSRPREHPLYLRPTSPPPLHIPGRLGALTARGDGNYYHFLVDVLSRLALLEQAAFEHPDLWYAPTGMRFHRELLDLFDIPGDRIIDADSTPHVCADVLLVADLPSHIENNPPWVVAFLRERLLSRVQVRPGPDVFVTRGASTHNRSIRNEAEVVEALTTRGFVTIDPGMMSVREQIETFAGAHRIVGAHGAALTNLIFASPGATVVELFPAGCLLPDFWRLACGVSGLRYRYLSAPGGPTRPTRNRTITRDLDVDVPRLLTLLDSTS